MIEAESATLISRTEQRAGRLFFGVYKLQPVICTHSHGKSQPLLPRCYQNTPYQEHPGAPSVTPDHRILVRIGLLGYAQFGPGTNYESIGRVFESP